MKLMRYALAVAVLFMGAGAVSAHEGHNQSDGTYVVKPGRPDLPDRTPIFDETWTGDPEKFTFCIIGDKTGGGENNWPIFDRAMEEVSRLNPDFSIMVGDLIQGYTDDTLQVKAQWEEFRSHADGMDVPFLYLPGNHDVAYASGQDWWNRYIGLTYYAFTYKNCLFIAMNTSELFGDNTRLFSDEQVNYVVNAINEHPEVRHTFIFMHHPAWATGNAPNWEKIEDALAGRKYSVIAGHWHQLQHEIRNDNRYIVHGATGAGMTPREAKFLGRFHHYSQVVVDGDSVYISAIEPGANWPINIAPMGSDEAVGMISQETPLPVVTARGHVTIGIEAKMKNTFEQPITVTLAANTEDAPAWTPNSDAITTTLAPGDSAVRQITMTARASQRVPSPSVTVTAMLGGDELYSRNVGPLVPYATEAIRVPQEWQVMGPFDVGPFDLTALPEHPDWAFPKVFEPRPPDNGWAADMTYEEGGTEFTWQTLRTQEDGRLNFNEIGRKDYLLGYVSLAVYSPKRQRVAARVRADNFAIVRVNGEIVGDIYGSPHDYTIMPMELKKGWNEVLVKLVNNRGDWYLWFSVFDPEGNLRFAPRMDR